MAGIPVFRFPGIPILPRRHAGRAKLGHIGRQEHGGREILRDSFASDDGDWPQRPPVVRPAILSKLDAKTTTPGDSGDWTYHVLAGNAPALRTTLAVGLLRFDGSGRLISTDTTVNSTGDFGLEAITFDFGNGTASGGNGLDGLTQYAALSAIGFTKLVAAYPESCRLSGVDTTGFLCRETAWLAWACDSGTPQPRVGIRLPSR